MEHEKPLSSIAYQNADGSVGKLSIHDTDAIHDGVGSVDSDNIADGSVRTEDIASKAVTEEKLADNAVGADAIKDGAVAYEKLSPEVRDSLPIMQCGSGRFTSKQNDTTKTVVKFTRPFPGKPVVVATPTSGANYVNASNLSVQNVNITEEQFEVWLGCTTSIAYVDINWIAMYSPDAEQI